jgi:uncharacterized cupin superfamily protein
MTPNPHFRQYTLRKIDDSKFIMSPVELKDYFDFEVKRVYFVSETKKDSGAHCHKKEKEFFILIQGTCEAVIDSGNGLEHFPMQGPTSAMYVDNYVWHQFVNFSPDAILLALSSTNYNPNREDYIEDYAAYLEVRDSMLQAEPVS